MSEKNVNDQYSLLEYGRNVPTSSDNKIKSMSLEKVNSENNFKVVSFSDCILHSQKCMRVHP